MTPPPVSYDELHQPIYVDQAHGVTPVTTSHVAQLPVCGALDISNYRLVVSPDGTQLRSFSLGTAPNTTNEWQNTLTDADRNRLLDVNDDLWQRIVGARGNFLYYRALQSGANATLFQPICRSETHVGDGPNARYQVFMSDSSWLAHPPSSGGLQAVSAISLTNPTDPVVPFTFDLPEIAAILRGVGIASGQYGIDLAPDGRFILSIVPDTDTLTRIRAYINAPNSLIDQSRRTAMTLAFQPSHFGTLAFQERTEQSQRELRSDMRWQMAAMGLLQVATTVYALGKGASFLRAVGLLPRMVLTPPVEALINGGRLLTRQPTSWDYTVRAFIDAQKILTTSGRHRATLDAMTIDATTNAREYQTEYTRAYTRALEEVRRTHPGLSQEALTDRARGAARNTLRGQYPEYVAADEMLHSIDLGLRSSNPDERTDAQARLDRIQEAERTLVQDKNANPVFVDVKGTGKSIRMHSIVLRSIRGESSVPQDAIQRRSWRELSRRGLMGTSEGDSAKFVGNLETNVQNLVDAIAYFHEHGDPNGLIIDEIHSFFGDRDVDPHVSKALQMIKGRMAVDNVIAVLGSTTPPEWTEVTSDAAMADRLRPIRFPPTNPATLRLALRARLLTISPDTLSRPDIDATLTRLIDSSFQLEGENSPRRVLDIALPAILSNGDLNVANIDQYFRNEKQLRINEVVRSVVGRFEPIALQARLMDSLHSGSSAGAISDADLRQRVVTAVMEICREKNWTALLDAEGTEIVTQAFTQTRAILPGSTTGTVTPPPVTPPPPPPPAGGGTTTSPLNRFRADALRDGDFVNGLNQADPTGRLVRAYRIISPEGRPLRNIGQFLDAVAVHYPDLMSTVTADLTRRGLDCNASPWRVLFEATARVAAADADGRIPRVRVADVQARMTQSADFDRNMGGGRPADADPTRVDPTRDRDRDRDARDPARLGRP